MQRYIHIVDSISEWIGRVFCWALIPLVFITAFEVFMRYIMKHPTIWAWDTNIQIFAVITLIGGGYTLLTKGHVTVDVFTINMSERKQAILAILSSFFFFFGIFVLIIKGWDIFIMSWKVKETMPTVWAPPYYPMKLLVPVGCFLLLLQGISEFLKNINTILGKNNKGKGD